MSIVHPNCIVLACDVCDDKFEDGEGTYHLETVAAFVEINEDWGEDYRWTIDASGYAVCAKGDESHASVRESLEKFQPQPEVPGQLAVEGAP